jgi:hypothetical protein
MPPTRTLFVAPAAGDDNADGADQNRPWRTLAYASRQLKAGDELVLLAGHYAEPLILHCHGQPGLPITVTGRDAVLSWETSLADAPDRLAAVEVHGSYVLLRGLVFPQDAAADAVLLNGDFLTVEDCRFLNAAAAVRTHPWRRAGYPGLGNNLPRSLVVRNNHVENAAREKFPLAARGLTVEGNTVLGGGHAFAFRHGCREVKAQDNYVQGARAAFTFDGCAQVQVYRNRVNGGGVAFAFGASDSYHGTAGVRVYNNVVHDAECCLHFARSGAVREALVAHNTAALCKLFLNADGGDHELALLNNLVAACEALSTGDPPPWVRHSGNVVVQDVANFVGAAGKDFRITGGSPAAGSCEEIVLGWTDDGGRRWSIGQDALGRPRPREGTDRPSAGAFERP